MKAPEWLDRVLADNSTLNLEHPDGRARLAEAITCALPMGELTDALREPIANVLRRRAVMSPSVVDELARNAAHGALQMLEPK